MFSFVFVVEHKLLPNCRRSVTAIYSHGHRAAFPSSHQDSQWGPLGPGASGKTAHLIAHLISGRFTSPLWSPNKVPEEINTSFISVREMVSLLPPPPSPSLPASPPVSYHPHLSLSNRELQANAFMWYMFFVYVFCGATLITPTCNHFCCSLCVCVISSLTGGTAERFKKTICVSPSPHQCGGDAALNVTL